jgi:hypothetical protein
MSKEIGPHSKEINQYRNHDAYPIKNKSPYAYGNTISGSDIITIVRSPFGIVNT